MKGRRKMSIKHVPNSNNVGPPEEPPENVKRKIYRQKNTVQSNS